MWLVVWFVLRGGLKGLWNASCRWGALLVAGVLAAGLQAEYMVTTNRRRRGLEPFGWAVAVVGPVDRVQSIAGAVWETHPPRASGYWRHRAPYLVAALLVILGAATWDAMKQMDASSEADYQLSRAFQHWRDLEDWAGVTPERRAEPGPALRADGRVVMPRVVAVRRGPKHVRVRLRCTSKVTCRALVRVHGASDRLVASQLVRVPSGERTSVLIAADHGRRVVLTAAG